ncbi:MAG: class I SAM-dependent methyltransferase [Planctomycetota bacterium]|nr:class I SAM-dependent methyltransferase [Planctomycetota bacterium]
MEYGRLLLAANTCTNLTGARDWYDLIESHLEDCARALALVPSGLTRFVDWGSGGGLPGLVWAALRPDWSLQLCERNGKKAAFLEEAARRLELRGVRVHARQFQEVVNDLRPFAQTAVARAVEPLARMLPKLAATRLPLLWMAGPSGEQEFWALPEAMRARWRIETLGTYALAEGCCASRGAG